MTALGLFELLSGFGVFGVMSFVLIAIHQGSAQRTAARPTAPAARALHHGYGQYPNTAPVWARVPAPAHPGAAWPSPVCVAAPRSAPTVVRTRQRRRPSAFAQHPGCPDGVR